MKHTARLFLCLAFACCATGALAADAAQTLNFYKRQALLKSDKRKEDRAFAAALAANIQTWLTMNPGNANAKNALMTLSDLYTRAGMDAEALVTLYKVRFLYPDNTDVSLLSSNIDFLMNNLNKRQKADALKLLAVNTQDLNDAQKRAALLQSLTKAKIEGVYAPLSAEYETFLQQHPSYKENDQLELLYGDLHRQNGNYNAAIVQYKKVNELYPDTPFKAASLRMTADVYADNLRDYETATSLYTAVLKQYPDSSEVGVVYKHMGIMEENRKNYDGALIDYNKAAQMLAGQPTAYEALRGKADVQIKLKDYPAAYVTLSETAEQFASDEARYTSTLLAAAELAEKRLKDPSEKAVSLEKILLRFPKGAKTPEVLYDLAYTYEKDGKEPQAMETYKRLIINYPTDAYGERAQDRLNRLEKKAGK